MASHPAIQPENIITISLIISKVYDILGHPSKYVPKFITTTRCKFIMVDIDCLSLFKDQ